MAKGIVGPEFEVGRQYAVIIGIDKYDQWPSLRSAAAEARDVKRVLADRYYVDEFFELYDKDATAAGIRRLFLDTLPKKVGLKDSLLIFYAGHGYLDESKTGFWIASDGDKDVYSQRGWIPNAQLRNYVAGLKVQRVLLVADACFSGDFLNVTRGAGPAIDSAYFKKALSLTARQVLTSGSSEAVPDESEFGRQLVSVLERNTESVLDPHTMFDRIRRGVTKTEPLIGTIPGNEAGATFALFLKPRLGTLSVSVASAADIYVDGVKAGRAVPGAPLAVAGLAPGPRRVEARYQSSAEERSVTVEAGIVVEAAFAYAPSAAGSLLISGFPEGAVVFLDGRKVGTYGRAALAVDGLDAGTHRARVEHWLWPAPSEYEIRVVPDKRAELAFAGGSIVARGLPRGVSVYLGGVLMGAAVKADDEVALGPLPAGKYSLRFEGVAWESLEQAVLVPAAGDVIFAPSFKPARLTDPVGPVASAGLTGAEAKAKATSGLTDESDARGKPRPQAGVGYLSLVSDPPGMTVLIDDATYATTPERLELASGPHKVKMRQTYLDGAYYIEKATETVTVPDGGEIELALKPERGLSVLDFSLVPPGYAVKAEGQPVRFTPLGKIGFQSGLIELDLEKAGESPKRYVTTLLPGALDRVPWGSSPSLALRMQSRSIDIKSLDSWKDIPPIRFPANPIRGTGGVLKAADIAISRAFICKDDKYLYLRVDFDGDNPFKKMPKGIKKSLLLELAFQLDERRSLSIGIENNVTKAVTLSWAGISSGKGKWQSISDGLSTYYKHDSSLVQKIPLDSIKAHLGQGVKAARIRLAHDTGSGWEFGTIDMSDFYLDLSF